MLGSAANGISEDVCGAASHNRSRAPSPPPEAQAKYFPALDQTWLVGKCAKSPKAPRYALPSLSNTCNSGSHPPHAAVSYRPVGYHANTAGLPGTVTDGSPGIASASVGTL